ncbi:MAG: tRNA glutamyl-Q(34) synthetase GluQRS [Porticoccaceae bacterium]|nr:tRNA glutamyl-Q(34) synthetase GluQRS [Porticoccaceae bacterium]
MVPVASYIGRFAPSPTGPLHLGSLYTALASYLDAHTNYGRWLVRMEDIDPPREIPGAADTILRQLENHGLHWDDSVLYQSQRLLAYQQAIEELVDKQLIFFCQCTRARLRSLNSVYDGRCQSQKLLTTDSSVTKSSAIRILAPDKPIAWQDLIRGPCSENLAQSCGDFIIVRRDGLFAYQLAVSVDDGYQGITHIIRGDDLLDSTPRQIYLLEQLSLTVPAYGHVPVIKDHDGDKLSKQGFAPMLNAATPGANIEQCLTLLGLNLPIDLAGACVEELLPWAIKHWARSKTSHVKPEKLDFVINLSLIHI